MIHFIKQKRLDDGYKLIFWQLGDYHYELDFCSGNDKIRSQKYFLPFEEVDEIFNQIVKIDM